MSVADSKDRTIQGITFGECHTPVSICHCCAELKRSRCESPLPRTKLVITTASPPGTKLVCTTSSLGRHSRLPHSGGTLGCLTRLPHSGGTLGCLTRLPHSGGTLGCLTREEFSAASLGCLTREELLAASLGCLTREELSAASLGFLTREELSAASLGCLTPARLGTCAPCTAPGAAATGDHSVPLGIMSPSVHHETHSMLSLERRKTKLRPRHKPDVTSRIWLLNAILTLLHRS